ncbi:MAG: T9SS type A sorting domain-containing protein, partial [Bacteroidetes bacterium]|nr:T9SS type A sorting domain-containing protein [Bacteroidota bacterium]
FPQTFTIVLPSAANNQPLVQIRWLTRDVPTTPAGTGGRASFALEQVSVAGKSPQASFTISNNSVCNGASVSFTNTSVNSNTYEWQENNTTFSTSLSPNHILNTAGSRLISLIAEPGVCADTASHIITVADSVGTIGSISGKSTVCEGNLETYSISPVANATDYFWVLPSGWQGSSLTESINASINNNSGMISVFASNACNSTSTAELNVTVNPFPGITITASAMGICQGESVTLTASGADFYTWEPAGSMNPWVPYPQVTSTFKVIGVTMEGCVGSQSITIIVIPAPEPEITEDGLLLSATSHDDYQWYLNGAAISGATSQTHTATVNGDYTVEVTENNCFGASYPHTVTTVGILKQVERKISVYPNPNNGNFSINMGNEKALNISLFDITGRNVTGMAKISKADAFNIKNVNLQNLSPGVYWLKIEGNKTNKTEKIVLR